jgi:hypothetical protein
VSLLKHSVTFDHIVFMKLISRLVRDIGSAFDLVEGTMGRFSDDALDASPAPESTE